VYVLVFVETREFFVRLVRERQTATAAARFAPVSADLVTLTAVATADRWDVVNQVLIVSHSARILTDERWIRLASVKMRG
jgi:hypothetical protein